MLFHLSSMNMLTEGHENIVTSTLWMLFITVVAGLSLLQSINEPQRQIKLRAPWAVMVVSLRWRGAIGCKGDPSLLTQPFKVSSFCFHSRPNFRSVSISQKQLLYAYSIGDRVTIPANKRQQPNPTGSHLIHDL